MKTAFMPGCALSSYNPHLVQKTALYLKKTNDDFTVIQKCCGKPTKLIGQSTLFAKRYVDFLSHINAANIERIICACPSCINTISDNKNSYETISLWEFIYETGLLDEAKGKAGSMELTVSIHDSCATRYNEKLQQAVRSVLKQMGYKIVKSENECKNTRCCGFGGMVSAANNHISKKNAEKCINNYQGDIIVTYCASCCTAMNLAGGKAWHILDLLWGDVLQYKEEANNSLSCPVKAWTNRYKSKQALRRIDIEK